eukprot:COSAG01_NODE_63936_length_278_cov_0.782123_1_plen_43_part_01
MLSVSLTQKVSLFQALVLQKTDLSRERMDTDSYNWLLAATFVL